MINQVSVFAPNVKGAMKKITDVMAAANINILALVTNDSAEYGIVRMLVDNPESAQAALKEKGYISQLTPVNGVIISDDCGGLNKLLTDLDYGNINVDYLYISYNRGQDNVTAVLHTKDDLDEFLACKGWTVL